MIRYLLTTAILFCSLTLFCQDTLTSNPNIYVSINDLDLCENTITVDDTTGLAIGTQLLLIQMQGATINENNSNQFGLITDLGHAGHYEWNHIIDRQGNVLTLGRNMVYDYEPGAGFQAIGFQIYEELYIQDTIRAKNWDGSTGGLIVLMATDSIILEAPVLANGAGFRGGVSELATGINCTVLTFNNNYFYASGNWRGAPKGEGIAAFISQKENGRGAQANGGGGGNNHNSGGGGGSSVVAGGLGGENNEPSFGGCDGFSPGTAGKPLPLDSARVFLGGGGGAGHRNNNNNTAGGNGGGIIIINTALIRFAGGGLYANGEVASNTFGDGAGGGGAGGTMYLTLESVAGTPDIELRGGRGGDVDNSNANRCFGPGGGGAGGTLYSNSLTFPIILSPGAAGLTKNSNSCGEGNNGATTGTVGASKFAAALTQGEESEAFAILSNPVDTFLCNGNTLSLVFDLAGQADLQWQIFSNNDWADLTNSAIYNGVNSASLTISSGSGNQRLRLQAQTPCNGDLVISDIIEVNFLDNPIPSFTSTLNGLTLSLTNNSSGADNYLWEFGDGDTSTTFEPIHEYPGPGQYLVCLSATNECGTFKETSLIEIAGIQAQINVDPSSGCIPLNVQFEDLSTGNITTRMWSFPGGEPAQSTSPNPIIVYNTPGSYDVQLIVSDGVASDTIFLADQIQVASPPASDFSFSLTGNQVDFNAQATSTTSYSWDFGDNNSAMGQNTQHIYANDGLYIVQLSVSNICGTDVSTQTIQIGAPLAASIGASRVGGCAPLLIDFSDQSSGNYTSIQWDFPGGDPATSSMPNPSVVYNSPGSYTASLTIVDAAGGQSTSDLIIEVQNAPSSNFTYEVDGLSVAFNNLSSGAQGYAWLFGDGTGSDEENPVHTYAEAGVYEVTLNAQAAFCSLATAQTIMVGTVDVSDLSATGIKVYPNPATDWLMVEGLESGNATLYSGWGQKLAQWNLHSPQERLSWKNVSAGLYFLHLQRDGKTWIVKVVVE